MRSDQTALTGFSARNRRISVAVHRILAEANRAAINAGASADERAPVAVAEADHAYELLRRGHTAFRSCPPTT